MVKQHPLTSCFVSISTQKHGSLLVLTRQAVEEMKVTTHWSHLYFWFLFAFSFLVWLCQWENIEFVIISCEFSVSNHAAKLHFYLILQLKEGS